MKTTTTAPVHDDWATRARYAMADAAYHEEHAKKIAAPLGLTVNLAFKGDRCPPWGAGKGAGRQSDRCRTCDGVHGDRYRVTLAISRRDGHPTPRHSLSFDFWASQHDKATGQRPSVYYVLACVASDASSPTDPDEVIEEYGPMKPSQAIAVARHAKRLQAFFTRAELDALGEIS